MDQAGRVLVVEARGAFAVDLVVGVARPLDDDGWAQLDAAPAMEPAAAARALGLPTTMPVHLRWTAAIPTWFDHHDRAWTPVDGATVRTLVDQRRRTVADLVAADPDGLDLVGAHGRRAEPVAAPDDGRWPVWPVDYHPRPQPNLALGLMLAAIERDRHASAHFATQPLGSIKPGTLGRATSGRSGALLFSHYVWSTRGNLRMSELAKAADPTLITIHGGPNVPGYPADVEAFFDRHPDVDVVVHGEGEATLVEALAALGAAGAPDAERSERLACLEGVAGLSYRTTSGAARGPKRKRLEDLDSVPSPYLTGHFDEVDLAGLLAVVETNRGCPFGCTFCDWGSATRSRVRTYDLDRVVAEVHWLAQRGVDGIFVADANFGALDRDLEVARAIADARREHGSPRQVEFTFAKDTAELLIPIVDLLWEAGVEVDGNLALQTVDEPTLEVVRRTNLPPAEYHRVRRQFRDRGLPMTSDIMLGLPGATYASMRQDVQFCLDNEITPRAHRTVLLPNAPMSAPEHRARLGIVADRLQRVDASTTFDLDDVFRAANLHRLADAFDNYGIARLVLRFVHRDHGIRETEVLERLDALSRAPGPGHPALRWAAVGFTAWMVPPGSWQELLAELGRWLVDELAIPDDDALTSVLAAQAAVLPEPGARFPRRVELTHDVAAWWHAQGYPPDPDHHRPLSSFGPAVLEVDDEGRSDALLVSNVQSRAHSGRPLREVRRIYGPSWELRHPMARPKMLDVEQHAFRYAQ